eukprot:3503452-Ditylum_brightwellii.AAC.2
MAIHHGVINPYTFEDQKMLPVPPGTYPDWVATYMHAEEENEKHPNALIAANNEKGTIYPLYASQLHLRILLPEYNPKLLTPIKVRAD